MSNDPIDIYWRISLGGDKSTVRTLNRRRGGWEPVTGASITPGLRGGEPDTYTYVDHMGDVARAAESSGFYGALLINFVVTRYMVPPADAPLQIPCTVFKEQVAAHNVVEIYAQGATVEGTFSAPVTYPPEGEERPQAGDRPARAERAERSEPRTSTSFTTTVPAFVDPGLESLLIANGVVISAVPIRTGASPLTTQMRS